MKDFTDEKKIQKNERKMGCTSGTWNEFYCCVCSMFNDNLFFCKYSEIKKYVVIRSVKFRCRIFIDSKLNLFFWSTGDFRTSFVRCRWNGFVKIYNNMCACVCVCAFLIPSKLKVSSKHVESNLFSIRIEANEIEKVIGHIESRWCTQRQLWT